MAEEKDLFPLFTWARLRVESRLWPHTTKGQATKKVYIREMLGSRCPGASKGGAREKQEAAAMELCLPLLYEVGTIAGIQ